MRNFVLSIFVLFPFLAAAQKVTATVDRKEILIGEQVKLRLQANFLKGEETSWFEVDSIARFEILEKSSVDTSQMNEGIALSQVFTITSWDSGKLLVPPFVLGKWKTAPLPVNVAYEPHPFDTTKPYHDIKDILEVKNTIEDTWYWYVILALVILGLFLLFFPKGKKKESAAFVPDEGAFKRALKQLDQLKAGGAQDHNAFHTSLIRIFREYLHKRKNIYSFSKTTDDLAVQMQQLNMPRDEYSELIQTLRLSDLVKFARYQPTSTENETSVDTIKQTIINIERLPHAV